jgi:Ser/Thr protein kinase RdoA (MazF antagonist)
MLPDTARICLTHGDLHLGNILVIISSDEPRQVRISGIVDWEQAGWYPEYWEYCKAMIVGPYGDEWRDAGFIHLALPAYEPEFEAFEQYWSWKCP